MRLKLTILIILLTVIRLESIGQDSNKKLIGVFTQQLFYRFTIVEFKNDMTFNYHIMSERAHRQTSGKYTIIGDTIILDSYSIQSDYDFQNKKWIILSRKQILMGKNLNDKKENWSILVRDKDYDSVPKQKSDLAIKIDSLKTYELDWKKDTTNYDSELKLIIHEPDLPKEPPIIIDGFPLKYNFKLNYLTNEDVDTIICVKGKFLLDAGFHGGNTEYGMILITTKNKKPKR